MTHLKKLLRLFGLAFLIMLAMTGVGLFGALFTNRDRYENKPINIEMRDRKEKESEMSDESDNS